MTTVGVTIDPRAANAPGTRTTTDLLTAALEPFGRLTFLPAGAGFRSRLDNAAPDIVFTAMRFHGAARLAVEVAEQLEAAGVPFSGSGSAALSVAASRRQVKDRLSRWHVPAAAYSVVEAPGELDRLAGQRFPLAVFPDQQASSAPGGLVVDSAAALESAAGRLWDEHEHALLVERHLTGVTFSCLVLGNSPVRTMLPPVSLPSASNPTPGSLPALDHVPLGLLEVLETLALDACNALELRDIARVDLALSDAGVPHVVAVDPLPDLHEDEGNPTTLAIAAAGMDTAELAQRCLMLSAARTGVELPALPSHVDVRRRTPPRGLRIRMPHS
jgi:D-alanine-D-alanine ligase